MVTHFCELFFAVYVLCEVTFEKVQRISFIKLVRSNIFGPIMLVVQPDVLACNYSPCSVTGGVPDVYVMSTSRTVDGNCGYDGKRPRVHPPLVLSDLA